MPATFFYGSYINVAVLQEAGLALLQLEVARLPGFDIRIRPLANLMRSDEQSVYGIITTPTHAELDRLYAHARDVLGGTYLPEAVLVQTRVGMWLPVLCYLAPTMEDRAAANDYIDRIAGPARK